MCTDGCSQVKVAIGSICSCLCTVYHNGKAKVMMVDSVHTEEIYRRQGYGARLMAMVQDLADMMGVDSIELVANKENDVARRLYARAGFNETEKVYYRKILKNG